MLELKSIRSAHYAEVQYLVEFIGNKVVCFRGEQFVKDLKKPLLSVLLVCVGCFAAISSEASEKSKENAKLFSELDLKFDRARLDLRAPGMIYGVILDGELAHIRGFGVRRTVSNAPVRGKTAFRIASMTKMMTALLIQDLYDQGKLSLDTPAEKYVPVLRDWKYPTKDSRKITVRDLMNHSAGFVTDDPWADRQMARSNEDLSAFLRQAEPFSHAPGEAYEYSNLGYVLLGRIIENVTGSSFGEVLSERLLVPLGMEDSGLEVADLDDEIRAFGYNWINDSYVDEPILASGSFDPLGGLWTTADDYAKFIAWYVSAWPARDDREQGPLPRRVVRAAAEAGYMMPSSARIGLDGDDGCLMSRVYTIGIRVNRHCNGELILSHGGGFPGFGSHVVILPDLGLSVFAFANTTYANVQGPVWDAAFQIKKNGVGKRIRKPNADARLIAAYQSLAEIYGARRIDGGGMEFEDNFFQDRSAARWNEQLSDIWSAAGPCNSKASLENDGRLSAAFTWNCEKARVKGTIVLSPINPSRVQMLHLRAVSRDEKGRDMNPDYDFH